MSVISTTIFFSHSMHERADECLCPKCNSPVTRIQRRFIDRLASLVKPVQRYRCSYKGWGCDWEGNLP